MSQFKRKSPLVDAVVLDEPNLPKIKEMLTTDYPPPLFMEDGRADIWTPGGILRGNPGDFLVKFPDGYVSIYKPESFAQAFETTPKTDKVGHEEYAAAEAQLAALKEKHKETTDGQEKK